MSNPLNMPEGHHPAPDEDEPVPYQPLEEPPTSAPLNPPQPGQIEPDDEESDKDDDEKETKE